MYIINNQLTPKDNTQLDLLLSSYYDYMSKEKEDFRDKILFKIINKEKYKENTKHFYIKHFKDKLLQTNSNELSYFIREENTNKLTGIIHISMMGITATIDILELFINDEEDINEIISYTLTDLKSNYNIENISIKLSSSYKDKYSKIFIKKDFKESYFDENYGYFYKKIGERANERRKRKY